ncbi:MAG: SAM-dependent methyltransferase [Thermodesulfobacteriota bacterium]
MSLRWSSPAQAGAPRVRHTGLARGKHARAIQTYELRRDREEPRHDKRGRALLGGHGGRVRFVQSLGALGPESVTGVVLSNELMDALPFRRARFEGGSLREILVTLEDGRFIEATDYQSAPEIERYFAWKDDYVEGQEVEVNFRSAEYMKDIARVLKRGFALTIDYGYLEEELFSPDRMKGTATSASTGTP